METIEALLISFAITGAWLAMVVLITNYLNKRNKDKDDKEK